MNQPKLYCLCGATVIDEFGATAGNGMECSRCHKVRCGKCMWDHLRKCQPALFLRLRTHKALGRLTEDFNLSMSTGG